MHSRQPRFEEGGSETPVARHGARRFITVSPLGVERLLRIAGFKAHRLAPPTLVDGNPVFACSISCEVQTDAATEDSPYRFALQA